MCANVLGGHLQRCFKINGGSETGSHRITGNPYWFWNDYTRKLLQRFLPTVWQKSYLPFGKLCSLPCVAEAVRYPDKNSRLYPGIPRDTPHWDNLYRHRVVVERTINPMKDTFVLDSRKSFRSVSAKADTYLCAITQLVGVLLADSIHKLSLFKSLRKLIAWYSKEPFGDAYPGPLSFAMPFLNAFGCFPFGTCFWVSCCPVLRDFYKYLNDVKRKGTGCTHYTDAWEQCQIRCLRKCWALRRISSDTT